MLKGKYSVADLKETTSVIQVECPGRIYEIKRCTPGGVEGPRAEAWYVVNNVPVIPSQVCRVFSVHSLI
jgi:hypothetical protein